MTKARYLFVSKVIANIYTLQEQIELSSKVPEKVIEEYNYNIFLLKILLI